MTFQAAADLARDHRILATLPERDRAIVAIDRNDLAKLLPIDPRRAAVGAYWRRVAIAHSPGCAGFRLAYRGEIIVGPHASGEWAVYQPATSGKWGRSARAGIGAAPSEVVWARLASVHTHADAVAERVRLARGIEGVCTRIAGVYTVTEAAYDPAADAPVQAWWYEQDGRTWRLRHGVVGLGTHAASADEWAVARAMISASVRRSAGVAVPLTHRWVSYASLRRAGACTAGISAAWPAVAAAIGAECDMQSVGAVRADVVAQLYPQWVHAAI